MDNYFPRYTQEILRAAVVVNKVAYPSICYFTSLYKLLWGLEHAVLEGELESSVYVVDIKGHSTNIITLITLLIGVQFHNRLRNLSHRLNSNHLYNTSFERGHFCSYFEIDPWKKHRLSTPSTRPLPSPPHQNDVYVHCARYIHHKHISLVLLAHM